MLVLDPMWSSSLYSPCSDCCNTSVFSFYSGGDLNSLNLLQLRSAVAVLFAFFLVKGIAHVKSGATSFYMELSRLWSTVL